MHLLRKTNFVNSIFVKTAKNQLELTEDLG